MERPKTSTSGSGESASDDLSRLEDRLSAFETERKKPPPNLLMGHSSAGYRVLGRLLSGFLGGIGLGWLVDHFAHTTPWGLVIGLFVGAGLSVYSTVREASAESSGAKKTGSDG